MSFHDVKVGDQVTRLLGGKVPMILTVTQVDADLIHCGSWTFDRATGAEVDDTLGWGPNYGVSGSYLTRQGATVEVEVPIERHEDGVYTADFSALDSALDDLL